MTREQRVKVAREVAKAIVDSVREADPAFGAPGGILYAALAIAGCSFDQYTQIMGVLERSGVLTRKGECYFVGPKANLFGEWEEGYAILSLDPPTQIDSHQRECVGGVRV
jgi:hypothetical protein